ncbi:endonuclease/exonuclease/phosphatase family protein [uncultured Croceitalea sp.]|uniref:endonuclease/exonuclease/phosphatase family protein n=1 Tax=uncultured Croceitalea sp. TaxID=1798908 RepID=UPI0033068233
MGLIFPALLALVCLMAIVPGNIAPSIAVLTLATPFLFVINLVIAIYWLFVRYKRTLVFVIALVFALLVFDSPLRWDGNTENVGSDDFSLMSYNVWGFNRNEWIKEPNIGDKITEFIRKIDPDVLCLQEHSRKRYKQLTQYSYRTETPYSASKSTQAIFSKFPIVGHGSLDLPKTINNIIFADILIEKDTVRVYNVHLQSYSIVPNTDMVTHEKETKRTYRRIAETFAMHYEQASILVEHVNSTSHPVVIAGDFNNTQFSNAYRTIKADMQDSFLEKGTGLGRTFKLLKLPMRIDYILADSNFDFTSHVNYDQKYSDHYPIMATLKLRMD